MIYVFCFFKDIGEEWIKIIGYNEVGDWVGCNFILNICKLSIDVMYV